MAMNAAVGHRHSHVQAQRQQQRVLWHNSGLNRLTSRRTSPAAVQAGTQAHAGLPANFVDDAAAAVSRLLSTPLAELMHEAAAVRDEAHPRVVTFSPKVFIPLTRLCRDSCGYCTFAQPPQPGRRAYMTLQEMLQVAQLGAQQGCTEALFTLGDKPELVYPAAAAELSGMGYSSTLEYVEAAAAAVLQQTGLIPHINAGVMDQQQLHRLKQVSGSQGLMLEGTSPSLSAPGGPHWGCPDKDPAARINTLAAAGEARVPFTTGLLIGLGESRRERLADLLTIQQLQQQYGHIQEVIIQNFRAKPHTAMQHHPEPSLDELLWTIAAARIILGPHMNIQAPPNLTPAQGTDSSSSSSSSSSEASSWRALLDAGINDWGGISPITRDYVNPEKTWPHLAPLAALTAEAGKLLLPRLPVYPHYIQDLSHSSSSSSSNSIHSSSITSATSPRDGSTSSSEHSRGHRSNRSSSDHSSRSSSTSSSRGSRSGGLDPWLSYAGGPTSVAAAVHRSADSSGLVRANPWVAGKPVGQTAEQQQAHSTAQHAAQAGQEGTHSTAHHAAQGSTQQHPSQQQLETQQRSEQHEQLQQQLEGLHHLVASNVPQQQQQQQQQQQGADNAHTIKSATPLPRPRAAKLWSIAVTDRGVLEGMPEPQLVSPRVQALLQHVLDTTPGLQQQQQQQQVLGFVGPSSNNSSSSSSSSEDVIWSESDIQLLLSARGVDMDAVVAAADGLRAAVAGDDVSYVVNRNINYTNVCTYACRFCAFSKGKSSEALRGSPYLLPLPEITRRTAEAWARGATEVCLQGGIHPDFTGQTYLDILAAAKAGAPDIHVHAFSPLEVTHGAATLGLSLSDYLAKLKAAGLGSLPGTAAEVLDDNVRGALCPDKLNTQQWLEVVETAHGVGLPTTSTIMFGHMDSLGSWARHLLALRELQARTGGITEFVPLPFVHMETPIYLAGGARQGPTLRECVLMHAVSRLVLHPHITNIQASWVKMGPQQAGRLLAAGCNDMGGSIMNESITRAAGAAYGQELPPKDMEEIIKAAGRRPKQRTTTYGCPVSTQTDASFTAQPLQPVSMKKSGSRTRV